MVRSKAEWVEVIGHADATNESDASAAARRILADLIGYRWNNKDMKIDISQLAHALEAYAYLLQEHGVKVFKD